MSETTTTDLLDYAVPVGRKLLPNHSIGWPGVSKQKFFKKIGYEPHPGQTPFHNSLARFRILFAGARFGKSCCAAREVEPLIVTPNTRGWIVAPSYELGEREFRYIYEDLIVKLELPTTECSYNIRQGNYIIRFPWNSIVQVKSAMKESTLLGEELDWVIMAEAAEMRPTVWSRYIRMRLFTRKGIAIFATSPKGFGWVFKKSQLGNRDSSRSKEEEGKWETFYGNSTDNPHNQDSVDREEMSEEDYSEQVEGIPAAKGGRCFSEFLSNIHVKPCTKLVLGARHRFRFFNGIDFGYTHPFVCLWGARDSDGNWYIYREYIQAKRLISDHIKHIKQVNKEKIEARYADPAQPEDRMAMAEKGLDTIKANKEIEQGIRSIKKLLIEKHPRTPSGRKLTIDPSCQGLIVALEDVVWAESKDSVKEVYIDEGCDPLDALRYMIHTAETAGAWGF